MFVAVAPRSSAASFIPSEWTITAAARERMNCSAARKDLPSNAVSYYFSDHLKTASVITDSAGNIKSESDYYPWGGELSFIANDSNHYKYTGKERDSETQLDYFGARYYSNGLGRFITPDWAAKPIAVPYAEFGNPQSLNLYRYPSNPETFADVDGHCQGLNTCLAQQEVNKFSLEPKSFVETAKGFLKEIVNTFVNPFNRAAGLKGDAMPLTNQDQQIGARMSQGAIAALPAAQEMLTVRATTAVVDLGPAVRAPSVLADRAEEIHSALDPIAQNMRTTAVADVTNADGTLSTLVSSSNNTLAPAQRAVLQPGETAVSGAGHAEETILNAAQQNGQTVNTMGVSRTPCPTCQRKLDQAGVQVQGPN